MIKVAILEDNLEDKNNLVSLLEKVQAEYRVTFDISFFPNPNAFFIEDDLNFDLAFFDIDMPYENGMDAARRFREMNPHAVIVFVTNLVQYAIEGYSIEASDYLLKPLEEEIFKQKISKIIRKIEAGASDSFIINTMEGMTIVNKSNIYYLEVNGHYIIYHTVKGDFSEYSTLLVAEKKINDKTFVRCNRSYLVNLAYVKSINRDKVKVASYTLCISRPQKNAFIEAFTSYVNGALR